MNQKTPSFLTSLLPMTSIDDSWTNFQTIKRGLEKLSPDVRLVCLPENSLYLNLGRDSIPKEKAFGFHSPEIKELQSLAKSKKLFIHLGGIPWLIDKQVFNEALLVTDMGEVVETYEKIHLFDVQLDPSIQVFESNSYTKGNRLSVFTIDGWKFATCICYDLRFPEIFIHYMENEQVDVFVVPAAFTVKTGEIHWKTLLKARAIETQSYILAPAQVGYHRDLGQSRLRKSWGQSLAINPWGKVLKETATYKEFLDSHFSEHKPIPIEMKTTEMINYRESVPISHHRHFKMELIEK